MGGPLVGIFPYTSMFVVTSIAMLRERTTGTLERLMTLPLAKLDLLLGYAIAFALLAVVQACITAAVAFGLLGLDIEGPFTVVILLAVGNALLGMALGLFFSAFARTEFQAVQFIPAVVLPQILLCGLVVPREQMARVLEAVSYGLPLTWAYDALDHAVRGTDGNRILRDALIVVGLTIAALALGASTLRRRTE
jgi:ABC-2 type transport system permease protein